MIATIPAASTRGVTLAALLTALGRPTWWVLALASFLIRGGIVLFLLAIVAFPSPLALSVAFGPIVTPLALGQVTTSAVVLLGTLIAAAACWLLAGTWIAAATEVVLARDARATAADEGLPVATERSGGRLLVTRAAAAHLIALVPLAIAVALGSVPIADAAYRELVNPSGTTPVVIRVLQETTMPVVTIVVLWVLGELVGGLAARRIVLDRDRLLPAVSRALGDVLRHPIGSFLAPLLTTAILAIDLVAVLLVVSIVWMDLRERLVRPFDDLAATGLALLTFGAAWCLALLVTGLIEAWRSASMTFERERQRAAEEARAFPT